MFSLSGEQAEQVGGHVRRVYFELTKKKKKKSKTKIKAVFFIFFLEKGTFTNLKFKQPGNSVSELIFETNI